MVASLLVIVLLLCALKCWRRRRLPIPVRLTSFPCSPGKEVRPCGKVALVEPCVSSTRPTPACGNFQLYYTRVSIQTGIFFCQQRSKFKIDCTCVHRETTVCKQIHRQVSFFCKPIDALSVTYNVIMFDHVPLKLTRESKLKGGNKAKLWCRFLRLINPLIMVS